MITLVAMQLDRAITTADEGFKACITNFMRVHYVSGLKPEIRRLVFFEDKRIIDEGRSRGRGCLWSRSEAYRYY